MPDMHSGVRIHIQYTRNLKSNDKKFSMTSPKRGVDSYLRLWYPSLFPEGIPSSKRIMQDINYIVDYVLLKIVEVRRVTVPRLSSRAGKRKGIGSNGLSFLIDLVLFA